jgi:hypothetical protein
MNPATTTSHRGRALLGVVLTAVLALGAALVARSASRDLVPAKPNTALQSMTADCPSIGPLVAAAVTATSPTGTTSDVTAARSRATTLARATASDDVRELVQNLADDLAAYRTTLTIPSTERHTDISAAIHGDLTALRRLCGR